MPKGTILDRLAGAMKTLSKREGKSLTPRQRVAAAQRWNSLADIGGKYVDNLPNAPIYMLEGKNLDDYTDAIMNAKAMKIIDGPTLYDYNRADNPFLSDNIDKYAEQSNFLDWCRYNRVEPNGRSLKQFRWETYKTLPYREQMSIRYPKGYMPENDIPYQSLEEFPNDFDYMWRY